MLNKGSITVYSISLAITIAVALKLLATTFLVLSIGGFILSAIVGFNKR